MTDYGCGACSKNQSSESTAPWNDYRSDIEIPQSVEEIGDWAFASCYNLTHIVWVYC